MYYICGVDIYTQRKKHKMTHKETVSVELTESQLLTLHTLMVREKEKLEELKAEGNFELKQAVELSKYLLKELAKSI